MAYSRVIALIGLAVALLVPAASRADQRWLVLSDIHLNPYDALQRPSRAGSDPNLALFESSLAAMKRVDPDPAVVLIPGDFLAHHFERLVNEHAAGSSTTGAALETIRGIAKRFAQAFPHAQFAIVLGNNDDPCGDYRSETGGPYERDLARVWAPLVNRNGAAPHFAQDFERGGYYVSSLQVHGLRLVALNAVFFSKVFQGDCKGAQPEAAATELAWLRATLASTPAGTRNVLMMHIPPGYDPFATELARGLVGWPFLSDDANGGLLDAISTNANRIAFVVAGHTHRFDVRIVPAKPPVPMFVFGSLSPIYGSNPAFETMSLNPDGNVRDISIYAFDEASAGWMPGRSFDEAWKVTSPALDAATLFNRHLALAGSPKMRTAWEAQSVGWAQGAQILWGAGWRIPWCAQIQLSSGFNECAKSGDLTAWIRAALAIVPALLLVVILVIILRRRVRS